MSRMTDFTVPSTVPGRTLHAFCCEPEGEVRAVLQPSHGMVEFIDRYSRWRSIWPGRASWWSATTTWATAGPSAPRPTTATLPSRTATVPCWTICTP